MFKSLYLRRTILLVIATVVLCAVLTAGLYSVVSRYVFADLKTAELTDTCYSVSLQVANYYISTRPYEYERVQSLITAYAEVFNTNLLVFDYAGDPLFSSYDESEIGPVDDLVTALGPNLIAVLNGAPGGRAQPSDYSRFVIIGAPVLVGGQVLGAVYLITPMREVTAALSGLLRTLLLSSLAGALLMAFPAFYFSKRLLSPLHEIKNVANAMSNGNFRIRAGRRYRGEFGELAAAFDNLADNLSVSIAALSLERTRLRQVLDGLAEGIVAVDRLGAVTHVNPAIRRIFGTAAGEGSARDAVIPDLSIWSDFDRSVRENISLSRNLLADGQSIRAAVTPILDEDGTTAGAVGLFRDITESQRLEQTRRDYVANVSHEMRTPLTAMRALVEPLADGMVESEPDRRRYYSMLLSEITRLTRLINDMLELSRLQAGTVSMNKTGVSLRSLLEDVAAKYGGVAEEADIRLATPYRDRPDAMVHTNLDRIEQILFILLDNAVKYTPSGGCITLDSGLETATGKAWIRVEDTGIGIAAEDLPHVFERFYKADKSRRPTSGTGLGLSIAREILDALGEEIIVESTPGRGTAFRFTLALAKTEEAE